MASIATLDDLEPWLTIDNEDRAEAVLAAASTLVQAKTGQAWVDAAGAKLTEVDDDDFQAVKTVVVQVALRVYQNPLGVTQQSTGPFSRSVAAWAAFGLSLTPDERSMLPTTIDSARPGLWTLGTSRYDDGLPDRYLDVVGQEEQIVHVPAGDPLW